MIVSSRLPLFVLPLLTWEIVFQTFKIKFIFCTLNLPQLKGEKKTKKKNKRRVILKRNHKSFNIRLPHWGRIHITDRNKRWCCGNSNSLPTVVLWVWFQTVCWLRLLFPSYCPKGLHRKYRLKSSSLLLPFSTFWFCFLNSTVSRVFHTPWWQFLWWRLVSWTMPMCWCRGINWNMHHWATFFSSCLCWECQS